MRTEEFEALIARKDAQVAELLGRDEPPAPASSDTVRAALKKHEQVMDNTYAKAAINFPVGRGPAVREPARSWANDYQVRVGDFSMPASLLLTGLLRDARLPALLAEIASATPGVAAAILSKLRES